MSSMNQDNLAVLIFLLHDCLRAYSPSLFKALAAIPVEYLRQNDVCIATDRLGPTLQNECVLKLQLSSFNA
jgi:hypothetical protein